MRHVILDRTSLKLSRFGFGTAHLFNAGTARRRQRLLFAAFDHGVTHFDTAPYYGFGMAERDLKEVLAAHPYATIATKVGVYPPGGADQSSLSVLFRKVAGKFVPAYSKPTIDWSVARAKKSLEDSLRRLGRERVDIYLLHEPEANLLATEEWLTWLRAERDRVATFGIACNPRQLLGFLKTEHPLTQVIQALDSISGHEADIVLKVGRPLQITYGYLTTAKSDPSLTPEMALEKALLRNSTGCVLVSTSKEKRFSGYARLLEKDVGASQ